LLIKSYYNLYINKILTQGQNTTEKSALSLNRTRGP